MNGRYLSLLLVAALTSLHIAADEKQTPITLTAVRADLKSPQYAQTVLPNNFDNLVSLLLHGNYTQQSRDYTNSVFRLFNNLIKSSEYVNADAFTTLVTRLPDLLSSSCTPLHVRNVLPDMHLFESDSNEYFRRAIEKMLYDRFRSSFNEFKTQPERFIEQLSKHLCTVAQEETNIEQLRQMVVRFLETNLAKLIWSPEDGVESWESVKAISNHLGTLAERNIIHNIDDLDDLYWTLVNRYAYFVDLSSTELPLDFYQQVKSDIKNASLIMLDTQEEDSLLESRSTLLLRTMMAGEARRRATMAGEAEHHLAVAGEPHGMDNRA